MRENACTKRWTVISHMGEGNRARSLAGAGWAKEREPQCMKGQVASLHHTLFASILAATEPFLRILEVEHSLDALQLLLCNQNFQQGPTKVPFKIVEAPVKEILFRGPPGSRVCPRLQPRLAHSLIRPWSHSTSTTTPKNSLDNLKSGSHFRLCFGFDWMHVYYQWKATERIQTPTCASEEHRYPLLILTGHGSFQAIKT